MTNACSFCVIYLPFLSVCVRCGAVYSIGFFEAAEIAKFTSREFGEHWENLKSFRDWYSVMSTPLKKGREEDLKEGLETGL